MHSVKQITWDELQQWRREEKPFQLIDVREPEEHRAFNIGGDLIPLSQIMYQVSRLELDKPIVLYCKRGLRSQIAIQRLGARQGDLNLYNLQGGIWSLLPRK